MSESLDDHVERRAFADKHLVSAPNEEGLHHVNPSKGQLLPADPRIMGGVVVPTQLVCSTSDFVRVCDAPLDSVCVGERNSHAVGGAKSHPVPWMSRGKGCKGIDFLAVARRPELRANVDR